MSHFPIYLSSHTIPSFPLPDTPTSSLFAAARGGSGMVRAVQGGGGSWLKWLFLLSYDSLAVCVPVGEEGCRQASRAAQDSQGQVERAWPIQEGASLAMGLAY